MNRNKIKIFNFYFIINTLLKNQRFFNNESSFSVIDLIRKGYSFKGTSIHKLIKHKRNRERFNLLMAISNKQVIAYEISTRLNKS